MTPEQRDKIVQTLDLLRQDVLEAYRDTSGWEEVGLAQILVTLADLATTLNRATWTGA